MQKSNSSLVFVSKKCRSQWCPTCGVGYWGKVRAKIKPHFHLFKKTRIITLTVDPKNFKSGYDAYIEIEKKEQYIKRFLRLFGFKKAFKVMAFHKSKPIRPDAHNWPHWHVVVDLADISGRINLRRMWKLWRDRWGIGGLDLQVKRKFRTADSAINYAVSYCQHQCGNVADWVLDAKRSPRSYEFYGSLRKVVSVYSELATKLKDPIPEKVRDSLYARSESFVGERIKHCSDSSAVFVKTEYKDDVSYKYLADFPVSPSRLAFLSKISFLDIERYKSEVGLVQEIRVKKTLKRSDDPLRVLKVMLLEYQKIKLPEVIPI